MQTRLKLLHDWNHQLHQLLPDVRSTRVDVLALLTLGVLWSGSVTLLKVAACLPLSATDMSTERRFRRWLANRSVPVTAICRPLVSTMLASRAGTELVLALDPTPQGAHKTVIVLGLVAHKRVLPLLWHLLPSQARWAQSQHTYLSRLCRVVAGWLPQGCTVTLVADRGLVSRELVLLCRSLGWHYVLRLSTDAKQGYRVRHLDGREQPLWELVTGPGQRWYGSVELFKRGGWVQVELTLYWERGYDEPWILISDRPAGLARVRQYRKRWCAEPTYQDCKRRGWDLEASRITADNRLNRLLLVLFIVLWWAQALGARVVRRGLRTRFDRRDRRELSLVRLGRRWVAELLCHTRPHPLLFRYHTHNASWSYTWLF
ncbi:MAG: transposase [Chloroflexota bacterium]|nr:transposase [Chloroflexota bacterium]